MLLGRHIDHTKEVLKFVDLPGTLGKAEAAAAKEQILLGCQVNDLLEFTGEAGAILLKQIRLCDLQTMASEAPRQNEKIQNLFYQSHWGQLASLHVMATKANMSARETWSQVALWWEFLQGTYLGSIKFKATDSLEKSNTPIRPLFQGLDQPFSRLFDTKVTKQIKYRSLGMLLHLIQDSYTPSHCYRTSNGQLGGFYCYNLQDSAKHKAADDVAVKSPSGKVVLKQSKKLIDSLLQGKTLDFFEVFNLKKDALSAYAGEGFSK